MSSRFVFVGAVFWCSQCAALTPMKISIHQEQWNSTAAPCRKM